MGRGETKPGDRGGQGQRRGFGRRALEALKISLSEPRNQAIWASEKNQAVGHALEPLKISRWAGEKPSQVGGGNRGDRGNDGGLGMRSLKISLSETRNQARWAGRNQARWAGEKRSQVGRGETNEARWVGEKPSQVSRGETKPGGRGEQGGQEQRRGFGHAKDFTLRDKKPSQVGRGVWACVGAAKDFTLADKEPSQVGRGETKPGGRSR